MPEFPELLIFLIVMKKHFTTIFYMLVSLSLFFSVNADSKVYLKKDEALELAFPDAQKIEEVQVFLDPSQVKEIESRAMAELDSKLYIFYRGAKDGQSTGYALIETHKLRTKTETVMYVISPKGKLKTTEILAFFEPPDYQPGSKWLNLYNDRKLDDSLKIGRDIPNITGATITSHAFAKSVRKILAIFEVAVQSD